MMLVTALVWGLLAMTGQPADATGIEVNVGGRVAPEAGGQLRFGWPGVYFEGRFRGPAVRVRFEAPAEHMRLLIDGEERARFLEPGSVDMTITGLVEGDHVVRLEKLTESQTGGGRFAGFTAVGGRPLPPARRARQIEYIGDSYTVGYGNTSPVRECTREEVHDRTDTQQAFGPLSARRLGADYRVIAYSGFGIVRNYAGRETAHSLPIIYGRPVPDTPAIAPDDAGWRPQLIVINLGTNDFSTPLAAGERWADEAALRAAYRETYAAFIRAIGARQPQARFILMGSDGFIADVEQVAAAVNAGRAQPLATTLRFGDLALTGCDWHPSLEDNRQLADQLVAAIGASPLGWREE